MFREIKFKKQYFTLQNFEGIQTFMTNKQVSAFNVYSTIIIGMILYNIKECKEFLVFIKSGVIWYHFTSLIRHQC